MHFISKSWLLLTCFVFFYAIYLLFGALVFSSIERPMEDKNRDDINKLKNEFLRQSCVNETALEVFLVKVLTANKYGVSVLPNTSISSNWDLASSMFFANTLVTTVGYGRTIPLSDSSKVFAIFYTLIGVPFTMLVLTVCVQRLMFPLVHAPVCVLQRAGLDPRKATVVHFILLLVMMVLGFFMAPAAVFAVVEGTWSFLDAIYFCFISLCTVGLGDFVPGEQPGQKYRHVYKVAVIIYLFVGLMMMYLLLRTFHKMADLHGLTSFLQLPHCEDPEEDREPILEDGPVDQCLSYQTEQAASKFLATGSQPSYNTITKD